MRRVAAERGHYDMEASHCDVSPVSDHSVVRGQRDLQHLTDPQKYLWNIISENLFIHHDNGSVIIILKTKQTNLN